MSDIKILYISPHLSVEKFGGAVVSESNLLALKSINNIYITEISVNRHPRKNCTRVNTTTNKYHTAFSNLFMLCGTLSFLGTLKIVYNYCVIKPNIVWLDTSLMGVLIPIFRLLNPRVKVVTYFHNIEAPIVKNKVKINLMYCVAYIATAVNEYLSATLSKAVIAIQKNDSEFIKNNYKVYNVYVAPVTINDLNVEYKPYDNFIKKKYVLFVGSDFPPNIEALDFLNSTVAPNLCGIKIVAVGNGLEKYVNNFRNIEVHGKVDDLKDYYSNALAVVAPIFSGGGMKVKIAEALMYDKVVIASCFAAIGYDDVSESVIKIADSPDDYVKFISGLDQISVGSARNIYLKHFSTKSQITRFSKIIEKML